MNLAGIKKSVLVALVTLGLAACATLPEKLPRGAPATAPAPAPTGKLAELELALQPALPENGSGFRLLDSNEDGLRYRLAVIDAAEHSLDIQYYYWWADDAGDLITRHVIDAANRGVKVRVILDDLTTSFANHRQLKVRDWQASTLNAHKNVELRLFNAFRARSLGGRLLDFTRRMDRMNKRMHNKLLIADNRAAIVGGRNLGDEYFGFSDEFNFHDLDVLGVGPVARDASHSFDRFWNSEWVVPVAALKLGATAQDLRDEMPALNEKLADSAVTRRLPLRSGDWSQTFQQFTADVHGGASQILADVPAPGRVRHRMSAAIMDLMRSAQHELLISNAYIIPDPQMVELFRELTARGVAVRILTNSLASQDVPAVNSHYKAWHKPLLKAGVELHEARPDAAIRPSTVDTPPTQSKFMGLHTKALVIDRSRVFIGSMNLDPRSQEVNSEMGVVVDSKDLAAALAAIMERDMLPQNAWAVTLDKHGRTTWTSDTETLHRQPAQSTWQRVKDLVFMMLPKNLY